MKIYFKQIEVGPMENFAYLVGDATKHEAVIIDPAWELDRLIKIAENDAIKIVGAIATHHHYDHTNGISDLAERISCPIYVNKNDVPFVNAPKSLLSASDDGDVIKVGDLEIKLIHTPGHTPGSQCMLIDHHLMCGDTLFIDGCGRCDLPGGDAEKMYYTLTQKIMRLPDNTIIMPGHNYAASSYAPLKAQKQSNPYLRLAANGLEDFLGLRMKARM